MFKPFFKCYKLPIKCFCRNCTFCHACIIVLCCLFLYLLIVILFDTIDCPECDACFCNECVNENSEQGKCHFHIDPNIFPMHVVDYFQ